MSSWEDVDESLEAARQGSRRGYPDAFGHLIDAVAGIYDLLRPPSERDRPKAHPHTGPCRCIKPHREGDLMIGFADRGINVNQAARLLHEAYETAAAGHGWRTTTQVPWEDLPEANQKTMLDATEELIRWLRDQLRS
jgi:hypothetical protein